MTCALCLHGINSDADRGYADTERKCQCLRDYHYDCLRAICDRCQRTKTNMRCRGCREQIFGFQDCERETRYRSEEDTEICPICQERLDREIELGKMRCTCTARYHYSCLQQYRNHESSYDQEQNGMKCVTCNGISTGIDRI